MTKIELANSKKKFIVDDDIAWKVKCYSWYLETTTKGNQRICSRVDNKIISLARFIMGVKGLFDHKDRDIFNNQITNLRPATYSQNGTNKFYPTSNKYKGIQKIGNGKFKAKITVNYQQYPLGTFKTAEEAAKVYNETALKYFGEFAALNKL